MTKTSVAVSILQAITRGDGDTKDVFPLMVKARFMRKAGVLVMANWCFSVIPVVLTEIENKTIYARLFELANKKI